MIEAGVQDEILIYVALSIGLLLNLVKKLDWSVFLEKNLASTKSNR